jgi:hypothetical protein
MKHAILLILFASAFSFVYAQKSRNSSKDIIVVMEPSAWEYDSSSVEFVNHRNAKAVRGKNGNGYQIFLKDHQFTNGTIEFDVELSGMGFPGINFRMSPDRKNSENFYLRSFGKVNPEARNTIQYAAIIDGASMWDLTDEYQSGAAIIQDGWNHVKLIVNGKQLRAYVNDMDKPALMVPLMESGRESGGISLSGNVIYANLVIKPNATADLSPLPGVIVVDSDTRYLRKWMVSEPKDFPFGKDLVIPLPSMYGTLKASDLPNAETKWTPVVAEQRSVVNLSRLYGHVPNDARRIAWLKTSFHSDKAQEKTLSLGFSDEVWVFLNGELVLIDKNYFGTPSQKEPGGRCTLDNTRLRLSVKEGNNEIMIALANYFYGWGIVARMNDMNGISLGK